MRVTSLTKKFGEFTALDSVSFEISSGGICVLAGPNGAGKTTLLRIVAGLLEQTSGSIINNDINSLTGVVMQESYLYLDLSVRENLELYTALYGLSKDRIHKVTALLDLKDFFDQDVGTLSHGQRHRASIARALLPDPSVLLLDEPFLGLDAESVKHVIKFLEGFKRNKGLALIATHELDIVKDIADYKLFLERGKMISFGEFSVLS